MTLEDFAKAERKRANNRLRDLWKYQPWIPGSTLDLGEHEGAFSRDLGFCGLDIDALPPSVADTARWRWRRLCLDRARHEAWGEFCRSELLDRIRSAGPGPDDQSRVPFGPSAPAFRADARLGPTSKRRLLDRPKVKRERSKRVVRHKLIDVDNVEALAQVFALHGATVRRVAGDHADDGTLLTVTSALRGVLTNPDDESAGEAWRRLVLNLGKARGS